MGNLTLEDVNNMYLDVLKEIGNIGAGNATTAIAKDVYKRQGPHMCLLGIFFYSVITLQIITHAPTRIKYFFLIRAYFSHLLCFIAAVVPLDRLLKYL